MMKTLGFALGSATLAWATPAAAETAEEPVYLLATLQVADLETYMADYGIPVTPMLLAAGAEILVATPQVQALEGDHESNWTVVVRFPSQAAAEGWYDSSEYQAMIPVRRALTDTARSTMVLAPQFAIPAQ